MASTRAAADELSRMVPAGAWMGVHRMSLLQTAAEVASEAIAARGLAPVTALGMEAVAARAAHALRHNRELTYFGPVAATPGFAGALASTISELRLNRVNSRDLAESGAPGRDLAALLKFYEQELSERGLADAATVLELASAAARAGAHRWDGLPLVLLDLPL